LQAEKPVAIIKIRSAFIAGILKCDRFIP